MNCLQVLSMLSVLVLWLWEKSASEAMTLNSIHLQPVSGERQGRGTHPYQRSRRSWVWNQFFVLEEYAGDEPLYVGKLHSDMDQGDGQVKYVLRGQGAMSVFIIDENTGDIHAIRRLDREQQAFYTLRAQARDRGTNLPIEPESQFVVKVQDINDNEPKFLHGPYTARVAECAPAGTSVLTVVATDTDDPTYGTSARLVYSLLRGQPYFSVEPRTGVVRTALPNLDREVQDCYLLVVQAKDLMGQMGGLSGSTSVTVILTDINDNPPHFLHKNYQFTVPESVLVSAVVAKIKALDVDVGPNAEIDYRILDGDGLGTFRILTEPNTQEGLVILQKALDFETRSSYTLQVEASNRYVDARFLSSGPYSDTAALCILVENIDEPPVFSSPVHRMLVSEAAMVGCEVGLVSAHDPDITNSPIRFSIDRKSDAEQHFNIDSTSGVIRISRPLDRETIKEHNITIIATESLDSSKVGKAVVLVSVLDVNDNAPSFAAKYQSFVCENIKSGQIIETLSAVDRDEGKHHFLFSLTAKDAGNFFFALTDNKDNTASVLTRRGGFQREQPVHVLTVVISDSGTPPLSSTNTLSVTVCDCDLNGIRRSCGRRLLPLSAIALTCLLTLLGITTVTVAMRHRRREPLTTDEERVVRENIVRYDDEGGGEEDTVAFDLFTLRHLKHTNPVTPQFRLDRNWWSQDFMRIRLQGSDLDLIAPPYDSLQTYAYEGTGSAPESLSSLNSSDSEQDFGFLRHWGSKFTKLADLYGHRDGGGTAHRAQLPEA